MTGDEFKVIRCGLFPRPTDAARALGVTYRALNHWEAGRRPVPTWAVKFLACLKNQDNRPSSTRGGKKGG